MSKSLLPIKLGFGSFFGSGNQWQSWIHIQDISNIFCHILKNDLVGVFNGVSPNPITNKDFTIKLAKFLNGTLKLNEKLPSVDPSIYITRFCRDLDLNDKFGSEFE